MRMSWKQASAVVAALAFLSTEAASEVLKAHAIAPLIDRTGKPVGAIEFEQTLHGVLIIFDLHGLPPGAHAVHVHSSGSCEPRRAFLTAGPHFSIEPRAHGYLAKGGPHSGDLPNQFAASDGSLHASVLANQFTIGNGEKSIFDRDGASIIVDERADDYASQPSGGSGAHIACGVIMRTIAPGTRKGASRDAHG
jgi:Cu-Zn family superoxide dismutase